MDRTDMIVAAIALVIGYAIGAIARYITRRVNDE